MNPKPVCTKEQAQQLLAELKAAYQSLPLYKRADIRNELRGNKTKLPRPVRMVLAVSEMPIAA